ncbi:unnamed protein product [Taenia asiatica]|uniref:EGF-like domain-containing protein n=1 Tax=Taenia asiatica TaxID=60517 RepID=A0A0R3W8F3_TAEAS|nr:unnamed protein product [Taenia asiatica]
MALVTSTREEDLNANETQVESVMEGSGIGQVPDKAEALVAPKPQENRAICLKCQGRSVCLDPPNGKASCFCPPDHTGEFCEVELVKLPIKCTKDQCENGGICKQGPDSTICVCSENYVGKNCSRVAVWISLTMNLYTDGNLVQWVEQNNSETAISIAACNQLTASMIRGANPTIATGFVDCDLQDFEKVRVDNQEGIRVTLMLKFDPGNNPKVFQGVEVQRHLELSPINIDFDADETISITNFDVCKANKHDCSPSASCIWDGVTYTCECSRFFTDGFVAGKLLPGRECYHSFMSGLLLGCLIILPVIFATFVSVFYCRRYQAKKEWVATSEASDALQLVSSQYPKYDA